MPQDQTAAYLQLVAFLRHKTGMPLKDPMDQDMVKVAVMTHTRLTAAERQQFEPYLSIPFVKDWVDRAVAHWHLDKPMRQRLYLFLTLSPPPPELRPLVATAPSPYDEQGDFIQDAILGALWDAAFDQWLASVPALLRVLDVMWGFAFTVEEANHFRSLL